MDIDSDALQIAQENAEHFESSIQLIQGDVLNYPFHRVSERGLVDTVIMNPPFGTKKNEGIDAAFVQRGLEVC
jgi:predicted RNA methylase